MDSFYKERFGLQKAEIKRIEHEDALVAPVFKITQANGERLILKVCERPNDYLREVYFLKTFVGKIPVPRILDVVEPAKGVHGAILMECLPGDVLRAENMSDTLAYDAGLILAQIHAERKELYGDLIDPKSLSTDPKIPFTEKFNEGMEECKNHLPEELLSSCRKYYESHVHLLHSVDGPCIIHRDYRPGNWMVYEGKIQGIIDWSSARSGFAEEDFCSMEHPKQAFLEGYSSIRKAPRYERLMPFLRLSKAVATIGFLVKRGIWNEQRRLYDFNRKFLDSLL
jgi:aminoglycoside phosphotransferase (APT) family kinase protein